MSPALSTPFPEPVVVEFIACGLREAAYMARLTDAFLERTGIAAQTLPDGRPIEFPDEFLLEIAAILRIAIWEHENLTSQLGVELPRAHDAMNDLMRRAIEQPGSFSPDHFRSELHRKVMEIIFRRFSWDGRRALGADVMVGRLEFEDEEAVLEAMAELLWARRYQSTQLTQQSRNIPHG